MLLLINKAFRQFSLAPPLTLLWLELLCLLGVALGTVSSQNLQPNERVQFDHITIEQGLSHNYVMCMMQDRKGYLWFGTGNGLDKYDGYRFIHYQFDPNDPETLTKNQVLTLYEDKEGIIWVGTSESTCKFDPRTEKFMRLERSVTNPYAFKYAQSFNEDEEGNLWVGGSFEGELRTIDRKTGKFSATNYADMLKAIPDSSKNNLFNLHIIFKDKRGRLWIGSPSGLHLLNLSPPGARKPSEISFINYRNISTDPTGLRHNRVTGIFEDHKGVFWIVTLDGSLNTFDPTSGKFSPHLPGPNKLLKVVGALETDIIEDATNNLWIGTSKGLYKIDKERKVFTSFTHDSTVSESLSNNYVYSLIEDKSGIIWAATAEGISKFDPNQKPFLLFRHNPANPTSLSKNQVSAICEDKEGVVWVGTVGGGLNALNKKTGEFTHYRHEPNDANSLANDIASAILEDRDGNLWIGNGEVLSLFNHTKKNFTHYTLNHNFLKNDDGIPIFTMFEDRQKIIWLGTTNGLISFDPKTGKTIHYPYDPFKPNGISDYWTLSVFEDNKGNMWVGHGSQALDKLDRKTGKFTHYKYNIREPGSISSNTVPSIYQDSKGNLWFGTGEGGLCLFDPLTQTFKAFTIKHGLAGNSVFSILEDNQGNLWLGTNNGLSKFSPQSRSFTNFGVEDGIQSKLFTTRFTAGAAFKGKDGTLYFGGMNGLNAFHPNDIRSNSYVPPVVITQFRLFDKPLPGKSEAKEIELDYDQNFFSLEFAALNYTSSHNNQYAYQLEGVDKNWVYSGARRLASYTDIDPGKYVFKVKGSNNDGIWNEKAKTLTIIINPPWWRTPWAYTFYGLCLLAVFFGVDRFQRRRLIQREREKARERELVQGREIEKAYHELKQTQAQLIQKEKAELENELQLERLKKEQAMAAFQSRTAELEMQALRAQMNPHFIFNCLNSINRFILKNESEAASDYLTKFAKLIRLILQNSQSTSVPLENELEALRLYIEMEVVRFEGKFTFQISCHPDLEIEDIELPPLIIQPYVENAIWHGLMHKEDKGHLLIKLHRQNGTLSCQITDDGVGRKRAEELKSKSASKSKSLGMQITAHRLELINALNAKATTVEIIDLVDSSGEACGTRVLLKIPV